MPTDPSKSPDATRKARIDRKDIESVKIDRSKPEISMEQVTKMCHVDPLKRKASEPSNPFLDALHDEACSVCEPPENPPPNYHIPPHWHHLPWDEVELKKHSLLDSKGHHYAVAPILDEVDLKRLGMIDAEGHHASKHLDEADKQKAVEIGSKAHQQLEMVCKINRNNLACKLNQPHIKISHDVEAMDDEDEEHKGDEPEEDSDDEPSSTTSTMLSARQPDNCADQNASNDGKEEDGKKSTDKKGASSEDPCKSFTLKPVGKSEPQKSTKPSEKAKEVKNPRESIGSETSKTSGRSSAPNVVRPKAPEAKAEPPKPTSASTSPGQPKMNVTVRTNPEMEAKPTVVANVVDTGKGQVLFNINFEVQVKPKPSGENK